MKRLRLVAAIVFLAVLPARGQEKLLIIHADDLAVAHSVNTASIDALQTGLVTSASIMIPCPWVPEIAAFARTHPKADLGLHLTLTSEWADFRWRPLLGPRVPSLLDPSGYLYKSEIEAAKHATPQEVEAEIRAQIARAKSLGIHPTHLDSHMGTLYQNHALFEVLLRVSRDEHLPARISREQLQVPSRAAAIKPTDFVLNEIISIDQSVAPEHWADWYEAQMRKLKPGVSEVVIHLAHDDDEMRAITAGHPNWGSAWRQRDLEYFTSERFRTFVRENGIKLTTWREVAGRETR